MPLAEAARTGESIYLESREAWIARYPEIAPELDASGHQANAVVPLILEGRVFGALGAAFHTARVFTADERAAVLTVSRQCALALERARLFESERIARHAAESANRTKSDFLAVISHELRTPLNTIDGYAELMELGIHGPLTEDQRQDLARIRKTQRHLLGLINGVLDYARVEAGAVRYAVRDVAVDETLATCESLVAPLVRGRHLALFYGGCDPELTVQADPEKLQQIVLNLLTNAIKFTEPGGRIDLACSTEGQSAHISVTDTGRGIPSDQLARVFEPFVQVGTRVERTQDGVGLGLAISRDLARGMRGDLSVVSELGQGSTFVLRLPRT